MRCLDDDFTDLINADVDVDESILGPTILITHELDGSTLNAFTLFIIVQTIAAKRLLSYP